MRNNFDLRYHVPIKEEEKLELLFTSSTPVDAHHMFSPDKIHSTTWADLSDGLTVGISSLCEK